MDPQIDPQNQQHSRRGNAWLAVFVFLGLVSFSGGVFANPVLQNVASGTATVEQSGNTTTIQQSSQQAVLNWNSFNIQQNESTHFQQPQGGMALNRIDPSQGVSQIFGQLTATGKIILINQAGIYFGPQSSVNVAGIIASTADITDDNFRNGNYQFNQSGPYAGAIINDGTIATLDHGFVVMMGHGVVNNGRVEAQLGHVVLAAGDTFTLSFDGNDLIHFAVSDPTQVAGRDQNGNPLADGVKNTGLIAAEGGTVQISTKAAQGVLNHAINMAGVTEAKYLVQDASGGMNLSSAQTIELDGGNGDVQVSGKVVASSAPVSADPGVGGEAVVRIVGHTVEITSNANVEAQSGKVILLGGEEADAKVIVAGKVNTSSQQNSQATGGSIKIAANSIDLQPTAVISANGPAGGGTLSLTANQGEGAIQFKAGDGQAHISANQMILNGKLQLAQDATLTASLGDVVVKGDVSGGYNLTISGAGQASSITGSISGIDTAITNAGSGTLIISGLNNTYTGGTYLNSGILEVANGSSLGTGLVKVSSNATLQLNNVSLNNAIEVEGSGASGTTGAIEALPASQASLNGAVTLTGSTSIGVDSGSSLTFSEDSSINGPYSLNFQGSGTLVLNGTIGGFVPLASLATSSEGATFLGADITTSGTQTYNGPLTLTQPDLTLSASTVTFNAPVDAQVAGAEGLNIEGNAIFNPGAYVGAEQALSFLNISGTSNLDAGIPSSTQNLNTVTTVASQFYGGPTTLGSDTSLKSKEGLVLFASTVDAAVNDPNPPAFLTLVGNAEFGGAVGGIAALSRLAVEGNSIELQSVNTVNDQHYTGVGSDPTLSLNGSYLSSGGAFISSNERSELQGDTRIDSAGGNISLGDLDGGSHSLTLNSGSTGLISAGSFRGTGTVTIENSNSTSFSGAVQAGTISIQNTATSVAFNNTLRADNFDTSPGGYRLLIDSGGGSRLVHLVEFSNDGGVVLGSNSESAITFEGGVVSTASTTTLAGRISTNNQGLILGDVLLTAATVLDSGNGKLQIGAVSGAGKSLSLVSNSGSIVLATIGAPGSLLSAFNLTTQSSASLNVAEAIYASGVYVSALNGSIYLNTLIDAEDKGQVTILGQHIYMEAPAQINVSGDFGGGTVNIGGSAQGVGPLANAQSVTVEPGASILANALIDGNGGQVVVWSEHTEFHGSASAMGAGSGRGGLIETSGQYLDISAANISLKGVNGLAGTWYLDPAAVIISASAGPLCQGSGCYSPFSGASTISSIEISNNLASGNNVVIQTSGDGSITLNANSNITALLGGALTLDAGTNGLITLNSSIQTFGAQEYKSPVLINADGLILQATAGTVRLDSNLNSAAPYNFTLAGGGGNILLGQVGNSNPFASLTLLGGGTDQLGTNANPIVIRSYGDQLYQDSLTLSGTVTLETLVDGNIILGDPNAQNQSVNLGNQSLTLNSLASIYLNAALVGSSSSIVNISAANPAVVATPSALTATITSGSATARNNAGVIATVNVGTFNLNQGQWFQSANSLPAFSTSTNFNIQSVNNGAINGSYNAQFYRLAPGNGLSDIYGLQGLATLNLSGTYNVTRNITAEPWTNTFIPIANFSGTIEGNHYSISNLMIASSASNVGLIGILSGSLSDLGLINTTVTASNAAANVGAFAGKVDNNGHLSNDYILSGTITASSGGNTAKAGGLSGMVAANGSITTSYNGGAVVTGAAIEGGLVGLNLGTISDTYSLGSVAGGLSAEGGLVGQNSGSISHSFSIGSLSALNNQGATGGFIGSNSGSLTANFWDTQASGMSSGIGSGSYTTAQLQGGCFGFSCNPSDLSALATFQNAGWSINSSGTATWAIPATSGALYPYLTALSTGVQLLLGGNIGTYIFFQSNPNSSNILLAFQNTLNSTGGTAYFLFPAPNTTELYIYTETAAAVIKNPQISVAVPLANNQVYAYSDNNSGLSNTTLGLFSNASCASLGPSICTFNTTPLSANGVYNPTTQALDLGAYNFMTNLNTTYTLNGSLTSLAEINFKGPVLLTGSAALQLTAFDLSFDKTIDNALPQNGVPDFSVHADAGSGMVTFSDQLGSTRALHSLTVTGAGLQLNAAEITTTANQSYNSAVTLGAENIDLIAGGTIVFNSTVDNASFINTANLQITSGTGTTFNYSVGSLAALTSLSVALSGAGFDTLGCTGGACSMVQIATTGSQHYSDDLKLKQDIQFIGGNLNFSNSSGESLGGLGTTIVYLDTATGSSSVISGKITGLSNLILNSANVSHTYTGTLLLSGSNTFQGGVIVDAGILQVTRGFTSLSDPGSLGLNSAGTSGGTVTLATGAVLSLKAASVNAVFNNAITVANGSIIQDEYPALTANTTTLSGAINLPTSGLNNSEIIGVVAANESLVMTGTISGANASNNLQLNQSTTINGSPVTYLGTYSAAPITASTYVGNTVLNAGFLQVGTNSSGASGPLGASTLIFNGGTLRAGSPPVGSAITINNNFILNSLPAPSLITGPYSLTLSGAGLLNGGTLMVSSTAQNVITTLSGLLTGSSTTGGLTQNSPFLGDVLVINHAGNSYFGTTTILMGTLKPGSNNSLSANSPLVLSATAGASFDLAGFSAETIGSLSGGGNCSTCGNILLRSGTLTVNQTSSATYSGVLSGSASAGLIVKNNGSAVGPVILTLTGQNTYSGATVIGGGSNSVTLALKTANNLNAASTITVLNNGVLSLAPDANHNLLLANNLILNNGAVVQDNGTQGNALLGSLSLDASGTALNPTVEYINILHAGEILELPAITSGSAHNTLIFNKGIQPYASSNYLGEFDISAPSSYVGASEVYAGSILLRETSAVDSSFGPFGAGSGLVTIDHAATLQLYSLTLLNNLVLGGSIIVGNNSSGLTQARLAGNIVLNADASIAIPLAADSLELNSGLLTAATIDSANGNNFALSVTGAGTLTLVDKIGTLLPLSTLSIDLPLNIISPYGTTCSMLSACLDIVTTGTQSYGGAVNIYGGSVGMEAGVTPAGAGTVVDASIHLNNTVTLTGMRSPSDSSPVATDLLVSTLQSSPSTTANISLGTCSDMQASACGAMLIGTNSLYLNASEKIYINAPITGLTANGVIAGNLYLSAANPTSFTAPSSTTATITTLGSSEGVNQNISVQNFSLQQGQWYQNSATLPTFIVTGNFLLTQAGSPSLTAPYNFSGQFIRMAGGDGASTSTPFLVKDVYGLQGIASLPLNLNYQLNNNIDASALTNFVAIGYPQIFVNGVSSLALSTLFTGSFNGNHYMISNLQITSSAASDLGLFVIVGPFGKVFNLGLVNISIDGTPYAPNIPGQQGAAQNIGGLAGVNFGTLYNDYILSGTIKGNGGYTVISPASFGKNYVLATIGGLVGFNVGTIGGPTAGVLTGAEAELATGAFIGSTVAIQVNSNANAEQASLAGGLVGYSTSQGKIYNSLSMATVTAYGTTSGDLVLCHSGAVGCSTQTGQAGGLVGYNDGQIANSFSTGLVTAPTVGLIVGGFVGTNGIIGSIQGSLWDERTSGQTAGYGSNLSATGFTGANSNLLYGGCSLLLNSACSTADAVSHASNTTVGTVGQLDKAATYSSLNWSIGEDSNSSNYSLTTGLPITVWQYVTVNNNPQILYPFLSAQTVAIKGILETSGDLTSWYLAGAPIFNSNQASNNNLYHSGFAYYAVIPWRQPVLGIENNLSTTENLLVIAPQNAGAYTDNNNVHHSAINSGTTFYSFDLTAVSLYGDQSTIYSNQILGEAFNAQINHLLYSVTATNSVLGSTNGEPYTRYDLSLVPNARLETIGTSPPAYLVDGNMLASGTGGFIFNGVVLQSATVPASELTIQSQNGNVFFQGSNTTVSNVAVTGTGSLVFQNPFGGSNTVILNGNLGGNLANVLISTSLTLATEVRIDAAHFDFSDNTAQINGNQHNLALYIYGGSNSLLAASINNINELLKEGPGTLIMSGNSTYSSTTSIANGVLEVSSATALGTSLAEIDEDGMLVLDGSVNPLTFSNSIVMKGGTLAAKGRATVSSAISLADSSLGGTSTNILTTNGSSDLFYIAQAIEGEENLQFGASTTSGTIILLSSLGSTMPLKNVSSGSVALTALQLGNPNLTPNTTVITIQSTADQSYNMPIILKQSAVLTGAALTLSNTIQGDGSVGGENLTLNTLTGSSSSISGSIGSLTPASNLNSLIINALGGSYNGGLTLAGTSYYGDTYLQAGTLYIGSSSSPLGLGTLNLQDGTRLAPAIGSGTSYTFNNPYLLGSANNPAQVTIAIENGNDNNLSLNGTGTFYTGSQLTVSHTGGNGMVTFGGDLKANDPITSQAFGQGTLIADGMTLNASVGTSTHPLNLVSLSGTTILASNAALFYVTTLNTASGSHLMGNVDLNVSVLGTNSLLQGNIAASIPKFIFNASPAYTGKLTLAGINDYGIGNSSSYKGTEIDGGILAINSDRALGGVPDGSSTFNNIFLTNGAGLEFTGSSGVLNANRSILLGPPDLNQIAGSLYVATGASWIVASSIDDDNIFLTGQLRVGSNSATGQLTLTSTTSTYQLGTLIEGGQLNANAASTGFNGDDTDVMQGPLGRGVVTVRSGAILQLSNNIFGNGIELNGGTLQGSSGARVDGPIQLSANSSITAPHGGDSLTINNTIDDFFAGQHVLTFSGFGAVVLKASVGDLIILGQLEDLIANLTIVGGQFPLTINTVNDQHYYGNGSTPFPVLVGGTLVFNSSNGSIQIGSSTANAAYPLVSGDQVNLTLNAQNVVLTNSGTGGAFSLSNSNLFLNSTGNISLHGGIAVTGLLTISAANNPASITTNTHGSIAVDSFILAQGQWQQSGASSYAPFSATQNFHIATGGSFNNIYNATFLRVMGGDGTVSTPYQIADLYGLQGMATLPFGATISNYNLLSTIDATTTVTWTQGFMPIGSGSNAYVGTFDGQNHFIQHLYMNLSSNPSNYNLGLFSDVGSLGAIKNLGVSDAVMQASVSVNGGGLVVGFNQGSLQNIYASGSLTFSGQGNSARLGGVVGEQGATGSLSNIYSAVTLSASIQPNNNIVTVTAGGLVGSNLGGTISTSFSDGIIQIDLLPDTFNNLPALAYAGGLVGENGGAITNSYSHNSVLITGLAQNTQIGGLVGYLRDAATITTSYSSGYVSAPLAANPGGFVGGNASFAPTVFTNDFWDTETSGQSLGVGSGSSAGTTGGCLGAGLCANGGTVDLSLQSTYTGWNFATIWGMVTSVSSYPYLQVFYPQAPRIISGVVSGLLPGTSATVRLAYYNGVSSTTISPINVPGSGSISSGITHTQQDGSYQFLIGEEVLPDTILGLPTPILVYLSMGGVANAVTTTPQAVHGSISGLNLTVNEISVGDLTSANTNLLSNETLAVVIKQMPSTFILYSVDANGNLTIGTAAVPDVNFNTSANTIYTLASSMTAYSGGSGNFNFKGPVIFETNSLNHTSGSVVSNGNQIYQGLVTLNSTLPTPSTTLVNLASTGLIRFDQAINGSGQDLNIFSVGSNDSVFFESTLGSAQAALGNLSVSSSGSGAIHFNAAVNAGSIATVGETMIGADLATTNTQGQNGNQDFDGPVILTGDSRLSSLGGFIHFRNTLDADQMNMHTLALVGDVEFNATVGGQFALGTLSVSGATTIDNLANLLRFYAVNLSFNSIDAAVATTQDLIINTSGLSSVNGSLGSNLGSFTLNEAPGYAGSLTLMVDNHYSGDTHLNGGTLILNNNSSLSTGILYFKGGTLMAGTNGIVVANDFEVSSTSLNSAIGGVNNLTLSGSGSLSSVLNVVNTAGTVLLSGIVADGTASGSLKENGLGGRLVLSNSNNSYTGPTTILAGTLQQAGMNVVPAGSAVIIGTAGTFDLNTYDTSIASLAGDTLTTGGRVISNSGTPILTTGSANTNTSFAGSIENVISLVKVGTGTFELAGMNSYSGTTTVNQGTLKISSATGLGHSLTTVNNHAILAINGVSVGSSNSLILNQATLAGSSVGSNDPSFAGNIVLTNATSNTIKTFAAGDDFTISGTINGSFLVNPNNNGDLLLNPAANSSISLNGAIGDSTPLHVLTALGGTVSFGAVTVNTISSQVYFSNLAVGGDAELIAGDANHLNSQIDVHSTIDGAHALTLRSTGGVNLNGQVGSSIPLASLSLEAVAGSTPSDHFTIFITNGGQASITTVGAQTYHDPLALDISFTGNPNLSLKGNNISFLSTVDALSGNLIPQNLLISDTGTTLFAAPVGSGATTLNRLVLNQAQGTAVINGGSIKTVVAQSFAGAITLGADTQLTATNGTLAFNGAINGAYNLNLLSTQGSTVNAAVSVGSLTMSGASHDTLNASVTTSGMNVNNNGQEYNDDVILTNNLSLISLQAPILFKKTLIDTANTHTLTLQSTTALGAVIFADTVDNSVRLGGLTTAAGAYSIDFEGGATINSSALFNNSGGVNLNSDPSQHFIVNNNLTNNASTTTIQGTVKTINGAIQLAAVKVAAAAIINGGQTVSLGTVTSSLPLGSYPDLTVSSVLGTSLNGNIDKLSDLTLSPSLTARDLLNANSISTDGNQIYSNPVELGQDVNLTSSNGGIHFLSSIDNHASQVAALNITTSGGTALDGPINIGSLTLGPVGNMNSGDIFSGGSLITSGNQTYHDFLALGADTILESTGGDVFLPSSSGLASSLGNLFSLTISNAGTNSSIDAVITDLSAFTKAGTGTLTLNAALDSVAPITISAGTLVVTTATLGQAASPVTVSDGATLEIRSNLTTVGSLFTSGYAHQPLSLSGSGANHQGALRSSCVAGTGLCGDGEAWAGDITLASDTAIGSSDILLLSSSGSFNGGNHALELLGSGVIVFNGAISNLGSLISNVSSGLVISTSALTTTGSQTYNSLLALGQNVSLTTESGDISINQGVEGDPFDSNFEPASLTLISNSPNTVFTVGGPDTATSLGALHVTNLTVLGFANGNNTLSVPTSNSQQWTVNQSNGGGLLTGFAGVNADHTGMGFSFTNLANLQGGSGSVRFAFVGAASLSGTVKGGANAATMVKAVDYSRYGLSNTGTISSVTVTLATKDAGLATTNNLTINHFEEINQILAGGSSSKLFLPPEQNTIYYSGALIGNISGKTSFIGFTEVIAPSNILNYVYFQTPTFLTLGLGLGQSKGQSITFSNFNIDTFLGSFQPLLLPEAMHATHQMYYDSLETLEGVATYGNDWPLIEDGSLFSVNLPYMLDISENIAQLIDMQKQIDEEYKKKLERTIKAKQKLETEMQVSGAK